jgi:hypothetical protein
MVYMSYVQAAVYDAVTKLEGRYEPYHDFTVAVAPGASVQAAVAAAARTTLDYYLPDQQAAVDAEYTAYLATLTGDIGAVPVVRVDPHVAPPKLSADLSVAQLRSASFAARISAAALR